MPDNKNQVMTCVRACEVHVVCVSLCVQAEGGADSRVGQDQSLSEDSEPALPAQDTSLGKGQLEKSLTRKHN